MVRAAVQLPQSIEAGCEAGLYAYLVKISTARRPVHNIRICTADEFLDFYRLKWSIHLSAKTAYAPSRI